MLKKIFSDYDPYIFWFTLVGLAIAIILGAVVPDQFAAALNVAQNFLVTNFSWFYMLVIAGAIVFTFWMFLSKYGSIKLGKDDDKPEYSNFAWFAMLFSCGIGVGFIFWGVAEPLYHFMETPYLAVGNTPEAAPVGIAVSLLHWGIHGWVVYAVIGMALAYSTYRLGNPLKFSSTLYPILGERADGPLGKLIDFLTVFATIAGISTTLGMGVISIKYGTTHLFGFTMTEVYVIIALILLITAYTISAITGLNRGIKKLSTLNMYLAFFVLAFIFIFGPTRFVLDLLSDSLGTYISNFVFMTFWTDSVNKDPWLGWWTVFYWGWWLSWGPFVGGFVARISKGRTIREFIVGVLFAPLALTVVWFSVVGGATIHAQYTGLVDMWGPVSADVGSGIYTLLSAYPLGGIIAYVVFLNMLTFIVTSADSAAFFVSMIISKGNPEPTTAMRIVWGISLGISAIILTLSGGLQALQTVSIVGALPFAVVMIAMTVAFVKNIMDDPSIKLDKAA
jgi:glycine betaine transporter